jgi:hypothetical protein
MTPNFSSPALFIESAGLVSVAFSQLVQAAPSAVPQGLNRVLKNSWRAPQSPSAAKAVAENSQYRSGEPLRHPKAKTESSFSAICKARIFIGTNGKAEAVPYPNRRSLRGGRLHQL